MENILTVGIGSFLGGIARFGLTSFAQRLFGPGFPFGTLTVNVLGCFLIGCVLYLVEERATIAERTRLFVGVGLLGGFTTFSAFGHETMDLLRTQQAVMALMNILGNVGLGLAAVWLGRVLLRMAGV